MLTLNKKCFLGSGRLLAKLAVGASCFTPVYADIQFIEVTNDVGISYVGPSWGGAWGDFNGDGLPDVWTSNHQEPEALYINQGGVFVDIAGDVVPPTARDTHGGAWADFDNDGDQDLIQLADGGSGIEGNSLLVNQGFVTFSDEAQSRGVFEPLSRGRTPLWFDYDNDGLLDLFVTSSVRATDLQPYNILFRQEEGVFASVNDTVGLDSTRSIGYVGISDLTSDGVMEMLTRTTRFPETIYEVTQIPFGVLTTLAPISTVDAAIADLNGDLRPDIYTVHGSVTNQALQIGDSLIESHLLASANTELGLDITTDGGLIITFAPTYQFTFNDVPILIGKAATEVSGFNPISLSASDAANFGLAEHVSGVDVGIFIGYEPNDSKWSVRLSALGFDINTEIVTSAPIQDFSVIGFNPNAQPRADRLLLAGVSGYEDVSIAAGINSPSWGRSVVAADFDNDMDLDIYILATGQTRNRDNILYENDGTALFTAVAGAGGAVGHPQGHGDAIAMADYDLDGYVDLFLTNGKSQPPWDQDGPVQLYRNLGGDNHWLEIDLIGSQSNRDGVGTIAWLTAGGVTQIREQNGGMHFRAQNHQRLHFGLGANESVEYLTLRWPSGQIQVLEGIAANQILTITEPNGQSCSQASHIKPVSMIGPDFGSIMAQDCNPATMPAWNQKPSHIPLLWQGR